MYLLLNKIFAPIVLSFVQDSISSYLYNIIVQYCGAGVICTQGTHRHGDSDIVGILFGIPVSVSAQLHVEVGIVRTYARLESDKWDRKIIWQEPEIGAE